MLTLGIRAYASLSRGQRFPRAWELPTGRRAHSVRVMMALSRTQVSHLYRAGVHTSNADTDNRHASAFHQERGELHLKSLVQLTSVRQFPQCAPRSSPNFRVGKKKGLSPTSCRISRQTAAKSLTRSSSKP